MSAIAVIGLGEAGSAFVSGWGTTQANHIRAYDIKSERVETAGEISDRCERLGIGGTNSPREAVAGATLVFCTVTADQAVIAAEASAPHLAPGAFWLDCNSIAPSSKQRAAEVITAAGGRYVDVAVMAPVHPKRNMVPLLLAGPSAEQAAPLLEALPMAPRVVEGPVGAASSIKMIRSVMVKGLEALTAECVLAAEAAGVTDEVLGSLQRSHPGTDWRRQAAYNFERSVAHGARRAAEMEEVVQTLADLGLPNRMASATARWQSGLAGAIETPDPDQDLSQTAGDLLAALNRPQD